MTLGDDVYEVNKSAQITLKKVYLLYDKYVGEDEVFPKKNGAPKIMTKYKDVPYTYELQPEYAEVSLCKGYGLDREDSFCTSDKRLCEKYSSG
jgi:hypothetical protein